MQTRERNIEGIDFAFWPAPVRHHRYESHLAAARAGGFTSLAISPTTYADALGRGLSARDIRSMAEDQGTPLRYLDSITSWAPMHLAEGLDEEVRRRWAITTDEVLDLCSELGLCQVLAVGAYDRDRVSISKIADDFSVLCEKAAARSIWVDLEPMPFFGCRDIHDAWRIVQSAAQPNCGILLDTWHFYRSGMQDLSVINEIPGHFLRTVQIDDAPLKPTVPSLLDETLGHRLFPGDGELPVIEFIQKIASKGGLRSIGPEVFSLDADLMAPEEAGRKSGESSRSVIALAGLDLSIGTPPTPLFPFQKTV